MILYITKDSNLYAVTPVFNNVAFRNVCENEKLIDVAMYITKENNSGTATGIIHVCN